MIAAIRPIEKLKQITEFWSPHIIAQMNDYHLKLAKIEGEFIWHSHAETDEVFIVIDGTMKILLRDGEVQLNQGDIYVVPKGVEHKPTAENVCSILLIEHESTINTGAEDSDLKKENLPWI